MCMGRRIEVLALTLVFAACASPCEGSRGPFQDALYAIDVAETPEDFTEAAASGSPVWNGVTPYVRVVRVWIPATAVTRGEMLEFFEESTPLGIPGTRVSNVTPAQGCPGDGVDYDLRG